MRKASAGLLRARGGGCHSFRGAAVDWPRKLTKACWQPAMPPQMAKKSSPVSGRVGRGVVGAHDIHGAGEEAGPEAPSRSAGAPEGRGGGRTCAWLRCGRRRRVEEKVVGADLGGDVDAAARLGRFRRDPRAAYRGPRELAAVSPAMSQAMRMGFDLGVFRTALEEAAQGLVWDRDACSARTREASAWTPTGSSAFGEGQPLAQGLGVGAGKSRCHCRRGGLEPMLRPRPSR